MLSPKSPDGIFQILLLTNRDSDNGGDQVIEITAKALVDAAMKNLGINNYKISSRAAGIVPLKYVQTRDESLLETAKKLISKADVVIFGGAPLFNYRYQVFYERTATTLEIAKEFNTPVIFSSIGVEGYDEDDEKCQRLKKTLNFDCVKQITTRDDFDSLEKFIDKSNAIIGKVSDPAVFTGTVFEKFKTERTKKRIGVFIIRANAFVDNKIKFSSKDAATLWLNLIQELEHRGYDYELLTSGHFGDEAFLDKLIKEYGVSASKCVFNMNTPEKLINKISSYDAIVSCRLHPSIIAFALGVPSIGIVWNSKVTYFYDAIGYSDRLVKIDNISASLLADKIQKAISQGVDQNPDYLMSVYVYLFEALKRIFAANADSKPYTFEELVASLSRFDGTSEREQKQKLERKFRRTYGKYNDVSEKLKQQKQGTKLLKKRVNELENRPSIIRRGVRYLRRRTSKKK